MGSDKVLIGGSMADATAAAAPFDVRYAYVHSKPAADTAWYTDSLCSAAAATSGWWGCWGGTTTAPGSHVTWWDDHVAQMTWQGKPRPQMFLWTWYSLRDLGDAAGYADGPNEVKAVDDPVLLTGYMRDFRFILQKIGNTRAMIDLEPDFWSYVRSLQGGNPHLVSAQVTAANPTDCATNENSAAGLAQCLISMAHKYAPNAALGMHLTCWDWETNTRTVLSGARCDRGRLPGQRRFRPRCGLVRPPGQRREKYFLDRREDDRARVLQDDHRDLGQAARAMASPRGQHGAAYQDDKVDYFFSHMDKVADAHIVGLLFGAGQREQTTPETDGGNLIDKTINYWKSGGMPLR